MPSLVPITSHERMDSSKQHHLLVSSQLGTSVTCYKSTIMTFVVSLARGCMPEGKRMVETLRVEKLATTVGTRHFTLCVWARESDDDGLERALMYT